MKTWQWFGVGFVGLAGLGAVVGPDEKQQGRVVTVTAPSAEAKATPVTQVEQEPVELRIQQAGEGSEGVVHRKTYVLTGTVTPGAEVSVDGRPARVSGSTWQRKVSLDRGTNWIDVEATHSDMESAQDRVEITRKLSSAERAARAAARERKRQRAAAREAARIAELTKSFAGSGSKNIGTVNVLEESVLVWTNNEDPTFRQMLIYDDGFGVSVASDAASGDTVMPKGRYKNITVAGGSSWTITIKPR